LLGIFVYFLILKGVFSLVIDTSVSSLYPKYDPAKDKILINIESLDKTMPAKEFSDKYSCDHSLVIQMLIDKKIKGYMKNGVWYIDP